MLTFLHHRVGGTKATKQGRDGRLYLLVPSPRGGDALCCSTMPNHTTPPLFPDITKMKANSGQGGSIAADLDGTLLISRSSFPYFMLIAIECGSLLRGFALLLALPVIAIAYFFFSESAAVELMIFISFSGIRIRDIELAARAVLPRFYAADVRAEAWSAFDSASRKVVVTANPRVMVEPFVVDFLGGDKVLGTEIEVNPKTKRATGFVLKPGVLVASRKRAALLKEFPDAPPDVGLGDRVSDYDFLAVCKEGYMVAAPKSKAEPVAAERLKKELIFHDGRLVKAPTPANAVAMYLWLPLGFILSLLRIYINIGLPERYARYTYAALGIKLDIKGTAPPPPSAGCSGNLYVCNHRTALDPIIIAIALGRKVSCVTYSVSRLSRFQSPIPTVALTRDRDADAARITALLKKGDLVICPEGTTCREPFLLRFSALFAELSERIVPVAVETKQGVFHGTTVRGVKFWDAYFFFMNPRPVYRVKFLRPLPEEMTCGGGGKTSIEVANHVQSLLAAALGFKCTSLTRKDKYTLLGGNDGRVESLRNGGRGTGF